MRNTALGLVPLLLATGLARADYSTAATGEVYTNTLYRDNKSGLDYGQKPSSTIDVAVAHTTSTSGESATESSHLQVLAEMGRLHAKAETYATTSFLAPNREDGGTAGITPHVQDFVGNGGPLGYDSFVGGAWRDVLHVRSATLPYGSLVQYRVHLELHSSVDVYAPLASGLPSGVQLYALFGGSEGFLLQNLGGSSTLSVDRVVSATVGENVDLTSTLKLTAFTSGTPHGAGPSYANVDAMNTGTFTLESLTPGATYTTDSGWLYQAQAVPEPSAFAALGLGALAMLRRRKK